MCGISNILAHLTTFIPDIADVRWLYELAIVWQKSKKNIDDIVSMFFFAIFA